MYNARKHFQPLNSNLAYCQASHLLCRRSYHEVAHSEHRAWTHSVTRPSLYSLLLTCIWCSACTSWEFLLCDDYCRRRWRRINVTDKLKYSILWLQFKCHYAMGNGGTYICYLHWAHAVIYLLLNLPLPFISLQKYDSFYGRTIFCNFNVMAMLYVQQLVCSHSKHCSRSSSMMYDRNHGTFSLHDDSKSYDPQATSSTIYKKQKLFL